MRQPSATFGRVRQNRVRLRGRRRSSSRRRYGTRAFESHDDPRVDLRAEHGGDPRRCPCRRGFRTPAIVRTRGNARRLAARPRRRRHVVGHIENPLDSAPPGVDGHALKTPREPHIAQRLADVARAKFDAGDTSAQPARWRHCPAGERRRARAVGSPCSVNSPNSKSQLARLWPRVVVAARHHGARADLRRCALHSDAGISALPSTAGRPRRRMPAFSRPMSSSVSPNQSR
mgnify:CR=1 FL=1